MKKFYILLISLLLLVITQPSFSEIYKWVDKDGSVKFSDKKPLKGSQAKTLKLKINPVKVPKISHNSLASKNKIIMYSAAWCGVCKTAKNYFNNQSIPFQEYDVEKTVEGRKGFKRLGGRGLPVILDGKKRMDGFDRSYFEKLYQG